MLREYKFSPNIRSTPALKTSVALLVDHLEGPSMRAEGMGMLINPTKLSHPAQLKVSALWQTIWITQINCRVRGDKMTREYEVRSCDEDRAHDRRSQCTITAWNTRFIFIYLLRFCCFNRCEHKKSKWQLMTSMRQQGQQYRFLKPIRDCRPKFTNYTMSTTKIKKTKYKHRTQIKAEEGE